MSPVDSGALNDAANAVTNGIDEISLHTGDPGTGSANEVSGGNYSRATTNGSQWTESGGVSSNNAAIDFADPNASWGTVTWVAGWDGSTRKFKEELTNARSIESGHDVSFPAGSITVTATSS